MYTLAIIAYHIGTVYNLQSIFGNIQIFSSSWISFSEENEWCFISHMKETDTVIFLRPWKAVLSWDPMRLDSTS